MGDVTIDVVDLMAECVHAGCTNPIKARGLCASHHQALWRDTNRRRHVARARTAITEQADPDMTTPKTRNREPAPDPLAWLNIDRLAAITANPETDHWWTDAQCRGRWADAPFYGDVAGTARHVAKLFCDHCPVRYDCLAAALRNREGWGAWAGTILQERKRIASQLRDRGVPVRIPPPRRSTGATGGPGAGDRIKAPA